MPWARIAGRAKAVRPISKISEVPHPIRQQDQPRVDPGERSKSTTTAIYKAAYPARESGGQSDYDRKR